MKRYALGACLFIFLFVILGGGLHLSPGGAFLAALSGTPLLVHVFNRCCERRGAQPDMAAGIGVRPRMLRAASEVTDPRESPALPVD